MNEKKRNESNMKVECFTSYNKIEAPNIDQENNCGFVSENTHFLAVTTLA